MIVDSNHMSDSRQSSGISSRSMTTSLEGRRAVMFRGPLNETGSEQLSGESS